MDPATPEDALRAALAADPGRPLLTWYDDQAQARIELSVATFANWVAKTANLLQDEVGLAPGGRVAIRLPAHWQALVWLHAAWAAGHLAVWGPAAEHVELAVVAHRDDAGWADADEVVSLGCGPLGLPVPGLTPAYALALDFDRSVHSHGDRFTGPARPDAARPALELAGQTLTAAQLLAQAPGPAGRLLVAGPLDRLEPLLGAAVAPVRGPGVVWVTGASPARLAELAAAEQVTHRWDPAGNSWAPVGV